MSTPLNLATLKAASKEELEAAILLAMEDEAFFNFDHGEGGTGEVLVLLLCNDTFGYACADCERIPFAECPRLWAMYQEKGWPALIQYIADKRGERPIEPIRKMMAEYKHKEAP
jgi:hypothetical protein